MVKKNAFVSFVFLLWGLLWLTLPAKPATALTAKLEPNVVAIGTFFNGAPVTVSGNVAAENDVLIILKGHSEDLTLKKKGRALGLLWMNLGEVTFNQVPTIYLLYSSKNLDDLTQVDRKQLEKLAIGFDSLKRTIEIEPNVAERDSLVQEFLKLKQSLSLYAEHQSSVHFKNIDGQRKSYEATVRLPSRIVSGEYEINVIELHGNTVAASTVEHLKIQQEGVPAMLSNLAFNHGALYGILAVLIAVGAGLLMNFFFGESKGAH